MSKKYISKKINNYISKSSWIRKMFEKGNELKQKFGANNVYDFSLGNPDVAPPKSFFENLKKLSEDVNPVNHKYMPNAGYPVVRKKMSKHLSEIYKKKCNENNIVMTTGAAGALNITLKTILDKDDEVIIISPYFVEYIFYIDNHGGKAVIVESDENFDINIEEIEKNITKKTKAIIINSPNNPTGKVYTKENLIQLSNVLKKVSEQYNNVIYLISDEPYRNIVYDDIKIPSVFEIYKDSVVVNSYSKELSLPGERIGYALINPDCEGNEILFNGLVLCNRISGFVNAPALMQRLVVTLLDEKVNVDIYEKRRNLLYNHLKECGYEIQKPEGAFYFFIKVPSKKIDDIEFVNLLQEENILAVPGIGFGRKNYFRLSYCVNENIIKGSFEGFKKAILKVKTK